jgi:FSR family fosmidomycin resistance protein-like MFS transporter
VSLLLRLFGNFSFCSGINAGKVGMISGLFFGFAFGMGGLGSALLGYLAETSIEYVYKISSYLPLIGISLTFYLTLKESYFHKFSFIYEYPWFISLINFR